MLNHSVNKIILVGYIAKDPRIHNDQSGKVTCFTLVTPEEIKGKGQVYVHEESHQVRVNSQQINTDPFKKGQVVYVQGRIQTKQYFDSDGVKRYKTEIIAQVIELLAVSPAMVTAENG